jgi:hypothetical protein
MKHKIKKGECVLSLAAETGHVSTTIWHHQANKGLATSAALPNILPTGENIEVPKVRRKQESLATDTRHRLRRLGTHVMLRLRIMDDDKPWANRPFVLQMELDEVEGTTDAAGFLKVNVPAHLEVAKLKIGDSEEEISCTWERSSLRIASPVFRHG